MKTGRPHSLRSKFTALTGAFMLFAASCGGSSDTAAGLDPTATSDQPAVTAEDTAASADGSLVVATVAGGQIDFGALEGQDVVLWFWAPW